MLQGVGFFCLYNYGLILETHVTSLLFVCCTVIKEIEMLKLFIEAAAAACFIAGISDVAAADILWDKTFKKSDRVDVQKVEFTNRYGIMIVGDLYLPSSASGKYPAVAGSDLSERLRNSQADFMLRLLQNEDLQHWRLSLHLPVKAAVLLEMLQVLISIPRIFPLRLIF